MAIDRSGQGRRAVVVVRVESCDLRVVKTLLGNSTSARLISSRPARPPCIHRMLVPASTVQHAAHRVHAHWPHRISLRMRLAIPTASPHPKESVSIRKAASVLCAQRWRRSAEVRGGGWTHKVEVQGPIEMRSGSCSLRKSPQ